MSIMMKGYVRLLSSSGDNTIYTHISNILNKSVVVPETHDCINPYNNTDLDLTNTFNQSYTGENDTYVDKYKYAYKHTNTTNNVFGGQGINIDYEFVQSEIVLDGNRFEDEYDDIKRTRITPVVKQSTPVSFKSVRVISQNGVITEKKYYNTSVNVIVDYSNPVLDYDLKSDYEKTRDNIDQLIAKGTEAVDDMLAIARQTEKARDFEVAGNMIKTIVDANKELLEIQKKMRDITGKKENLTQNIKNAVFVGSGKDFIKSIKQEINQ